MPSDRSRRFLSGLTHTFLQPDNKIGWKRYALRRARQLAADIHFDAVLATAPPFTDFLVGLELRQSLGIPLIVDYRDPWVDNKNYFYATPLHRGYATALEKRVLKNTDGIVVVNRAIKEKLIARYPFLNHSSVEIIPNGYDPEDTEETFRVPVEHSDRMRLTYSGHFDAKRTPAFMFRALAELHQNHPETRGRVELRFVGTFPDVFRKAAAKAGVASSVTATGYLEHREAVRQLMASDVLWLTIYDPAITPGKVYEYIGTGRPILALAPEGIVRQVLRGYGAEYLTGPEDVDQIAVTLWELFQKWEAGALPHGDPKRAEEFDQRMLTGRLARILAYSLRI